MEATSVAGYIQWIYETMDAIHGKQTIEDAIQNMHRSICQNANFILYHYQYGSVYDTPFWEYAKSIYIEDHELQNIIDLDVRSNMITYGFHTSQSVMNMYEGLANIYRPYK